VSEHPLRALKVALITAFDPWAVGNGSSMRAQRWCEALAGAGAFDAFVVAAVESKAASPYVRIDAPDPDEARAGALHLMSSRWREWMVRASPLPHAAGRVPAWLGRGVLDHLEWRPDVVVAFKMAVAPVAADLAMECGVPLVVDIDDDEAGMEAALGGQHAPALERLLQGTAELASVLTVASPLDVEAVSARVAPPVMVVPNAVDLQPVPPPGRPGRVMYVANFHYGPNQHTARWLDRTVVPLLEGIDELSLIGRDSDTLGLGPPTVAYGMVPSLESFYADAAVVVCPVIAGSGTSIKVIEALAHGRAVVTTTVGARGLPLVHGEHAIITDDPAEFAAAVNRLAHAPEEAAALGARGRALVAERYSPEVGVAAMCASVLAALERR
jgi:glycosyltransferase involved in cell wall biosynthesis